MYLQSHCFYKIGYASSRLYRRRFLDFLLYRRKQEQTTSTFSNNRFYFFRTPLQQQTEPPTTFSCCQQQAEGLVVDFQIRFSHVFSMSSTDFNFNTLMLGSMSDCMAHYNLTAQASRLSSNILQRSFFFFARMSCSEQSAFHGQASDRAWFFSELLFQSVAAKK